MLLSHTVMRLPLECTTDNKLDLAVAVVGCYAAGRSSSRGHGQFAAEHEQVCGKVSVHVHT